MENSFTRKVFNLAIASLIAALTLPAANAVTIVGDRSCQVWIKDRASDDKILKIAHESWILGYLSGLATGANLDFLQSTSTNEMLRWVDLACEENPSYALARAGQKVANYYILQFKAKTGQ